MTSKQRCRDLKLSLLAVGALLVATQPTVAQSYLDRLTAAEPTAAALLVSKSRDWLTASEIVKDRAAFMVFTKPFPKRSSMSPNDLIACLDKAAAKVAADTAVATILRTCTQ
jgi:hypothetical protein